MPANVTRKIQKKSDVLQTSAVLWTVLKTKVAAAGFEPASFDSTQLEESSTIFFIPLHY